MLSVNGTLAWSDRMVSHFRSLTSTCFEQNRVGKSGSVWKGTFVERHYDAVSDGAAVAGSCTHNVSYLIPRFKRLRTVELRVLGV